MTAAAHIKAARSKRIRRPLIWAVVLGALVFAGATGGWYLWMWVSVGAIMRSVHQIDVEQEMERFVEIKTSVFELIAEKDGHIPADPYRALVESGKVESFAEFLFISRPIMFPLRYLPARISPDIEQNRKIVLFWKWGPGPNRETWVCYCNGVWERWAKGEKWIYRPDGKTRHVKHCKPFYDFELESNELLQRAGYPTWMGVKDWRQWLRKNADAMVWDETLRMYIVRRDEP